MSRVDRAFDPALDVWVPLAGEDLRDLVSVSPAWLSGGLAIDSWLGRPTRRHEDTDISVLSEYWPDLAEALPSWLHPHAAIDGRLVDLERVDGSMHNIWCSDDDGRWRLQINIEAGDTSCWRYRRQPNVGLPWTEAVLDVAGMRVGAPEVQLLWKSKSPTPKDEADRQALTPHLDRDSIAWLAMAIAQSHPESPWRTHFDDAGRRIPPGQHSTTT